MVKLYEELEKTISEKGVAGGKSVSWFEARDVEEWEEVSGGLCRMSWGKMS